MKTKVWSTRSNAGTDASSIEKSRRNPANLIIARNERDVQYVVGSGRRGLSYLIDDDGFVVESPITWYSQANRWGLSPGYEELNYHFDRSVQPGCLFCHANRVEPVAGTLNRYRPPIFQGHEIGCERCHGPGELHVAQPEVIGGKDMTIVNPAALEPPLREAVCEQCHLSGTQRVERAGRRFEDYRPGLPVHRFWSVLVPAWGPPSARFVGHVEQMHESQCFRASEGRLGCISCHDPHRLPDSGERVAYYRKRCQQCHADRGCSLPVGVRLARSHDDDCTVCHMPRSKNAEIPHVATTDHRIPRQLDRKDLSPPRIAVQTPGEPPLVNFHRKVMDADELHDVNRGLAIALTRNGPDGAAMALPWLDEALAARPADVPAWQAKGVALGWLGRFQEGLAAFQTALKLDPNREWLLKEAAHGATLAGQSELAIAFWRRAISINPLRSDYHAALAFLYFDAGNWQSAAEACRETLRLNIANLDIRKLLVQCLLRLGDPAAARAEFDTLLGFDPPDRDDLARWFATQSRLPQTDKSPKSK